MKTRYYHLYANGKTVKEITQAEYVAIRQASVKFKGHCFQTARIHTHKGKMEIAISKGTNYVYITMQQIRKIEELVK